MGVKVNIFYPHLREIVEKGEPLNLTGSTIGECLNDLIQRFPLAQNLLFNSQGQLIQHIFVFVNTESLYRPSLDTPLKPGDTLVIASLVTGG